MNIQDFEKRVKELVPTHEHTGLFIEALEMHLAEDGCLSASYAGQLIRCEGRPWDEALEVIIQFIEKAER